MGQKHDGGPAHPVEMYGAAAGGGPLQTGPASYMHPGMSLRDWFAGQALSSGWCRSGNVSEHELREMFGGRIGIRREEIIAADAYAIADALLARRAKAEG